MTKVGIIKPGIKMPGQILLLQSMLLSATVNAGEVDVVDAFAECDDDCSFHVSLRHADEGWKHYANRWEVLTPDGKVIATRVLYHPHVNEQPFNRSQSGVKIPKGVTEVTVRGHDLVHNHGGKEMTVKIPAN